MTRIQQQPWEPLKTAEIVSARAVSIAVVDDHCMVAELIAEQLRVHGYSSKAVPVERSLLANLLALRADLVLLDIALGHGQCGLDYVEPLCSAGSAVICVSGTAAPEVIGQCLLQGADGFVPKVGSAAAILDAVKAWDRGDPIPPRPEERNRLIAAAIQAMASGHKAERKFDSLTPRECAVLAGMMDGLSAKDMAEKEFVSIATIRTQIRAVLHKLGVSSQIKAVAMAYEHEWSQPEGTRG